MDLNSDLLTPNQTDGSPPTDSPAKKSTPPAQVEGYLTPDQTAELLKIAKQTLARWRCEGTGPPYYLFGRYIRYGPPDLKIWAAGRRVYATSQKPAA